MSNRPRSYLEPIRRSEYTGENRCIPCTGANVVLALLASAVVAVLSVSLAAVLVASLITIHLRGYLVPGTPTLTERYLPDRVLAPFDEHPLEEATDDGTWETVERLERRRENAVDPERFLLDVGAIEPCEHEDDLRLSDGFARHLDRRTDAYDEGSIDPVRIAGLFDAGDDLTVLEREYPAIRVDRRVRKWPSEAALVADLVADESLRALTDRWTDVPLVQRLGILKSLRSFRTTCPRCSGPIRLSEDTVESCCRSYEVLTVGCDDCGEPLLEFNLDDLDMPGTETGIQP